MSVIQATAAAVEYESLNKAMISIMLDYKPRTSSEIVQKIWARGCNYAYESIKTRIAILVQRGWFECAERGSFMYYTLRKELSAVGTTNTDTNAIATEPPVVADKRSTVVIPKEPSEDKSIQQPITTLENILKNHVIDVNEGLDVCIWKVMCDYEQYTFSDLYELLSVVGVGKSALNRYITMLRDERKWFTVAKNPSNRRVFIYRLKYDIAMPDVGKPFRQYTTAQPAKAVTQTDTQQTETEEKVSNMNAEVTTPATTTAEATTKQYTANNASEQTQNVDSQQDIPATNFTVSEDKSPMESAPALLEFVSYIKGVPFNRSEMYVLRDYLENHLNFNWVKMGRSDPYQRGAKINTFNHLQIDPVATAGYNQEKANFFQGTQRSESVLDPWMSSMDPVYNGRSEHIPHYTDNTHINRVESMGIQTQITVKGLVLDYNEACEVFFQLRKINI